MSSVAIGANARSLFDVNACGLKMKHRYLASIWLQNVSDNSRNSALKFEDLALRFGTGQIKLTWK